MHKDNVVCGTFRLNLDNPVHAKINKVIMNLDPEIYKSRNHFLIEASIFYIENYGRENIELAKKRKEAEYIRKDDLGAVRNAMIQSAVTEAKNEVIRLLGGVIAGMQQAPAVSTAIPEKEEIPDNSYEDDEVIANCAMGWMMKGEDGE